MKIINNMKIMEMIKRDKLFLKIQSKAKNLHQKIENLKYHKNQKFNKINKNLFKCITLVYQLDLSLT